ncbi:cytochrome C [Sphingomonas sp. ID1715]|uniref:cytochrome c3 family protein n=1 Tax=Sphingomonas sp. ID1715 TaxID=1656898 RepID=UPI0014897DBD|nr:cytochrome c3 family protein [Sphingomonas sp. ID1715]NNM77761.1 cytochrome C [Sphingomonas sp. ID1715]
MIARAFWYLASFLVLAAVLLGLAAVTRPNAPASAGLVARLVSPGPSSEAHQSFAGQCTACHTPLKGVEAATCLSCHAGADFGGKQSTQFHAAAAQCTSCHVEHEGRRSPSAMDHDALLDARLWRYPLTVRGAPVQAASGVLDCAGCHSLRDPHEGLFGTDCATCHSTESWQISGYLHPSVNSTQCSECHKAPPSHYMEHFSMVSQRAANRRARVEQCFACHTTDSFNNVRGRGWYDHH